MLDSITSRAAEWASTPDPVMDTTPEVVLDPASALPTGDAVVTPLPDSNAPAVVVDAAVDASGQSAADAAVQHAMIEAMLGDTKLPIRADALVPYTVNGETKFAPLAELQKGYMRQEDYSRKTATVAEQRRATQEQEVSLRKAAAVTELLMQEAKAEQAKMLAAQQNPDEFARYLRHMDMLETDAQYKAAFDAQQLHKVREVEDRVDAAYHEEVTNAAIIKDITDTSVALAALPEFKGVTQADALKLYNQRLLAGQAELTEGSLRKAFVDLSTQRATILSPVQTELEAMRATLAEVQAQLAANTHNAEVRRRATPRSTAVLPAITLPAVAPAATTQPARRTGDLTAAAREWAST